VGTEVKKIGGNFHFLAGTGALKIPNLKTFNFLK
jgi:hypothetical protein